MICKIIHIINNSNEKTKSIMIYRLFLDMPYAEISRLLGISESSAKVIYHRGKIMLQKTMKEEYGDEI